MTYLVSDVREAVMTLSWNPVPERKSSPPQSNAGSPAFKLNLKTETTGLSFSQSARALKEISPMPTLRFLALTQMFVILILLLMVLGLLYWSWRLNYNVNYYYAAAQPYIQQAMDHGLQAFEHVDNSSMALENVMRGAELMSKTSIPKMIDAVNRTVRMVSRMEHLTYNPTIKMSLG